MKTEQISAEFFDTFGEARNLASTRLGTGFPAWSVVWVEKKQGYAIAYFANNSAGPLGYNPLYPQLRDQFPEQHKKDGEL